MNERIVVETKNQDETSDWPAGRARADWSFSASISNWKCIHCVYHFLNLVVVYDSIPR